MLLDAELALMAAAVALYLYDSALMLYYDEGVVEGAWRGRWSVGFGSTVRLRGREVFLPSPFAPHQPVFRLGWNLEGANAGAPPARDAAWTERRALFRPLTPFILGMALALFVLLPLGLFSRLGDRMVIAAALLLYLNILGALAWLAWKRAALGLSWKRLGSLSFEALVCSPFALNLLRKVSSGMKVEEDLVSAARRLQSPRAWEASRREFISRLREQLVDEDEGSARAAKISGYRDSLLAEEAQAI